MTVTLSLPATQSAPSRVRENGGIDFADKELRSLFPAVFNERPASRVSEEYQLYRTDKIVELFIDNGLKLVEIGQQRARSRDPRTQLHTLRFMPTKAPKSFGVNDSVPEIVIMNGHDGRNQFRALAGVFRFICSNGMVVADSMIGSTVRRHYGADNTFDKVMEIIAALPKAVTQVSDRIERFSSVDLDFDLQRQLAQLLMKERGVPEWTTPDLVLEARRAEDESKDGKRSLWTTFNVLQENLTNVDLERPEAEGARRSSIRPLAGAWANVAVNERLWAATDEFLRKLVGEPNEAEQKKLEADVKEIIDLENLSTTELAARYNEAAAKVGEKPVNRFADKASALRRTKAILERA